MLFVHALRPCASFFGCGIIGTTFIAYTVELLPKIETQSISLEIERE
jgi:hypothetical protein